MKQTSLLTLTMSTLLVAQSHGYAASNFADDVAFLKKHTEVVTLTDKSGAAQIVVVPAWQGRVMTSSADGPSGLSFGWVNRDLISSGKFQPHINVFGGEDRFWLGPEGGQFSIFFAKNVPFDLEHWFTPAAIDTEPFSVVSKAQDKVRFRKDIGLTNYSGTTFSLQVDREVRLVQPAAVLKKFGIKAPDGLKAVGFESVNAIKNTGQAAWKKDTGLLSIWMLGMFNAAPSTTVVIPFKPGPEAMLGPVVNDTYFGKIPAERLVVRDGVLYFAADANHRSRLGIPPQRVKSVLGSYDAANQVLTFVTFTVVPGATDFVNSMWELQKNPYGGDVVNSYNDGPSSPGGSQLGKFYELESSSPALALSPGQTATHRHLTLHFTGSEAKLNPLAQAVLGVGLEEIKNALKK